MFSLTLVPAVDKREDVIEILRSVKDLVRGKPGCLESATFAGDDLRCSVLYLEHWQSREDLHRHIQSPLYSRIIAAIELSSLAPTVCFYEVSKMMGMELIEALRSIDANTPSVRSLNERNPQ